MSLLLFENFSYFNRLRCERDYGALLTPQYYQRCARREMAELDAEVCRDTDEIDRVAAGKEIADVISYLDLQAQALGLKLSDIVAQKFNEVSDRIGSNVKIPV